MKTVKFFIHSDFQRRISWCHFVEIMVFSNEEKSVIKNGFLDRGWNAYKICKENPTNSWNRVSAYRLLKRFQKDNSMDGRAGSGRQRIITTEENENLIENLICSQEDSLGSFMSLSEVEKNTSTSRTSVRRMIKRKGLKQFKRLKTTMMSSGTQERRTKRAGALADRFRKNRFLEKCV